MKNYEFDFRFTQWGHCSVTMTSVSGHLTSLDFADRYRKWETTPPGQLFEAETIIKIDPVSLAAMTTSPAWADEGRNASQLPTTFSSKRGMRRYCSFGLIVTEKGSISARKFANRRERAIPGSLSNGLDSATPSERTSNTPS